MGDYEKEVDGDKKDQKGLIVKSCSWGNHSPVVPSFPAWKVRRGTETTWQLAYQTSAAGGVCCLPA